MNKIKKITIFGATGMLGLPVTKKLLKDGFQITAFVRDINKAQKVLPLEINLVNGDLQNIHAIKNSLKEADGVYISLSNPKMEKDFNPEKDGIENILRAAKEVNVKHIIFLSSFIARNYQGNWWMFLDKKKGIELVKESKIPYTIFYASSFMENFDRGMIMGSKVRMFSYPIENQSYWLSVSDYAKFVSNAFKKKISLNKEYAVQGPQGLTTRQAAEVFAENYTKKQLGVSTIPLKLMKFIGVILPPIANISRTAEADILTEEKWEAQKTIYDLGYEPKITLADFAKAK